MKILFYLQDGKLIDYYTSDGDYVSFLKNKEVDGYYLFDVKQLPPTWELNEDFDVLYEGFEGLHSNGNGYNIYIELDEVSPVRREAIRQIDRWARQEISQGFKYKDMIFSLSLNAQNKWNSWFLTRDMLDYPVQISTINDAEQHEIENADELKEMYRIYVLTINKILDRAQKIKEQVNSANSKDDIRNIISDFSLSK